MASLRSTKGCRRFPLLRCKFNLSRISIVRVYVRTAANLHSKSPSHQFPKLRNLNVSLLSRAAISNTAKSFILSSPQVNLLSSNPRDVECRLPARENILGKVLKRKAFLQIIKCKSYSQEWFKMLHTKLPPMFDSRPISYLYFLSS